MDILDPRHRPERTRRRAQEPKTTIGKSRVVNLGETDLSLRVINSLEEFDIITVAQLGDVPDDELASFTNFGAKTLADIYDLLCRYGYRQPKLKR